MLTDRGDANVQHAMPATDFLADAVHAFAGALGRCGITYASGRSIGGLLHLRHDIGNCFCAHTGIVGCGHG